MRDRISNLVDILASAQNATDVTQKKLLRIVRTEISKLIKPPAKIQRVRKIYETESKIAAIKEWRELNNKPSGERMSLRDAIDDIDNAVKNFGWKRPKS